MKLSGRLQAEGETPWCMGLESGPADGWPATDWIENLLLADAGTQAYDAWTFHELPFASPPVRHAFERFGEIVFSEGSVRGGPAGAAQTYIDDAQHPMLEDPPGCWLYLFPTFAEVFLPPEAPGLTDTFPFPPLEGRVGGLIGAGEVTGAFSDRPEVREVLRFLLSPEHGVEFAEQGFGLMSPNRHFELSHYSPKVRPHAEALLDALLRDTFRFDASDLMPPPVGDRVFLEAMMTYVREGPDSLDRILAELDAAWPDTG